MGKLTIHIPTADLARQAANAGHILASEHLLQVARTLVPLEEGSLERSGSTSVDEATLTANTTFDTPYSVVQHEALDYRHDAGRQAKYLEAPSVSEVPVFATLMAKAAKDVLNG